MSHAAAPPAGIMILHPALWPKMGWTHLRCDSGCGLEIFPLTPVEIEDLENGQVMFWHKECFDKRNDPEKGTVI